MNKTIIMEESSQPSCCSSNEPNKIETSDNKLYFYCGVNQQSILDFNKQLRDLDQKNLLSAVSKRSFEGEGLILDPIVVYIQSYGGSVFAGLSAMDTILSCKSPVYTVIDGAAASAATFMSVVGKKRFITKHSFALIHQLSSMSWGKYEELKEDMQNNDKLMAAIKDIYLQYTSLKKKELEEILKHDLWFDATECLSKGIVDKII